MAQAAAQGQAAIDIKAKVQEMKKNELKLRDEVIHLRNSRGQTDEKEDELKKLFDASEMQVLEIQADLKAREDAKTERRRQKKEEAIQKAKEEEIDWKPMSELMNIELDEMDIRMREADAKAEYESIEKGGEVIVEHADLGMKIFHIPASLTFRMLLLDVAEYYGDDPSKFYLCTKKGLIWTMRTKVLQSIHDFEQEMLRYDDFDMEDLHIQFVPKPPEQVVIEDDVYVPPPKPKKTRLTREEHERREKIRSRKNRMDGALRNEFIFHFVFSFCFIMVAMLRVPLMESFEMANSVRAVVEDDFPPELGNNQKAFMDVANDEEMYQFLQNPFIGGIEEWTMGNNNRIVGGFRIMTQRVTPNGCDCSVWAEFDKFGEKCYPSYSEACEDKEPYGPTVIYNNVTSKKWSHFQTRFGMAGTAGRFADYSGSGHALDFDQVWDPDLSKAAEAMKEIEAEGFTDDQTRSVIIMMTVYNQNYNLFVYCKIIFEFTPGGLVYPNAFYTPLKVDLYQTSADQTRLVFEILCAVFLVIFTIRFFMELKMSQWETESCGTAFTSFWTWYEIMMLIIGWACVGMLVWYMFQCQEVAVDVGSKYYLDFDGPAQGFELTGQIYSVGVWLCVMKSFKYMELSSKLSVINTAMAKGAVAMTTFFVIFMMVYMSFVFMGYQIFGPYVEGYSTFFDSVTSLFLSSAGVVDYYDIVMVSPVFAPMFFFMFVIIVVFIMLNMFIGIVCEAFSEASEETGDVTLMDEIDTAYAEVMASIESMMSNKSEEEELARLAKEMAL